MRSCGWRTTSMDPSRASVDKNTRDAKSCTPGATPAPIGGQAMRRMVVRCNPPGKSLLASPHVRAPEHAIPAPPFPRELTWVNVAPLRMDKQRGRPVLVEFWDFCRPNSLRTLPYLRAWHARYAEQGLRVIGVHAGGFPPARETDAVVAAVERLGVGESPPGDEEGALLPAQTADQPGPYSGPYAAGAAWAVVEGRGEVRVGGRAILVTDPGAVVLVEHPHHTEAVLALEVGEGVTCHATCFTPGVAPGAPGRPG